MITVLPASPERKRSERRSRPVMMSIASFSALVFFVVSGIAQGKPKTAAHTPATQEISWPKWNFAFTAPSTWRQYLENIEDNDKVPNGNHDETRYFTRTPDRPNVYPHSDLTITFTTWPGPEFKTKAPSGRTLSLSLEELMDGEQGTPETWKLEKNPQLEAIRYETLDGLKGVLLQRSVSPVTRHRPADKLVLDWTGYRVFDGDLQRISAAFECTRADLPRAETILHSFKFSK